MKRIIVILCLCFFSLLFSETARAEYDYGEPTCEEQLALELINRARMDPWGEAYRLGMTDLFEGVKSGDISGEPVQPLTMNSRLLEAAQAHAQDMIDRDYFAHNSPLPESLTPEDRIDNAGYSWSTWGENIAIIYSTSPFGSSQFAVNQNHNNLFVDKDYPNRGHRVNLLRSGYRELGAGVGTGPYADNSGTVYNYAYDLVCDFGASTEEPGPFLLGVAYNDLDGDEEYDIGEGRSGVRIVVSGLNKETYTANAGGYGIPVEPGTYTVQAEAWYLSQFPSKSVTIDGKNKKVDFILDLDGLSLENPPAEQVINSADPETAPVRVDGGNLVTRLLYSEPVYILVGVMDTSFQDVYWLQSDCSLSTAYAELNRTELSCTSELPVNSGYVFWLISPQPLSGLDWANGHYHLLFYSFPG